MQITVRIMEERYAQVNVRTRLYESIFALS